MSQSSALLVLGNQLFPLECLDRAQVERVIMIEDGFLCRHFAYHKQKLVLVLASMRAYAQELREAGLEVSYVALSEADLAKPDSISPTDYIRRLQQTLEYWSINELVRFEVEGKAMEARLSDLAAQIGIEERVLPSPMFLCSRDDFSSFLKGRAKVQMASFYKFQRTRLNLLIDPDGSPQGGRWSFDEDNRKKLPKDIEPPPMPKADQHPVVGEVLELVQSQFAEHPGKAEPFTWPVTRQGALIWLEDFLDQRLTLFGPYEDAISQRSKTLFHSVLSPLMNIGLLTPQEVVDRSLAAAQEKQIPLQSLEGFIRQVIGWREFVRGVHQNFSAQQHEMNFWGHKGKLTDAWYRGNTGIEPLDVAILEAQEQGWSHHIPRLMVVANLMTLCEIAPHEAHRWFMEMYVDSASWVMGPNVYGMGLFSDGGIFATKPYICGSNYLLKMSDYKKGPWCDVMDGLYWRFIHRNRDFFATNPRLALMPRALDRLKPERRDQIFAAAESFLSTHTR